MASISAYLAGDGPGVWMLPIVLLALLGASYFMRPASRRVRPALSER
jgi:hypothetical protein